MPRFVLLEHTGHPDDPAGCHFDLLLEEAEACRSWRLEEIPAFGGPPVTATPLPDHRLVWLDRLAGEVSGGRGVARRVDAGEYEWVADGPAAGPVVVELRGDMLSGRLTIDGHSARLRG
jgi:hypothetical protein